MGRLGQSGSDSQGERKMTTRIANGSARDYGSIPAATGTARREYDRQGALALSGRRYDLDWLRVLAFGLLILYHCGMYYVADWGWHIKSAQPSVFLQNLMLLANPWRMSLLFLVSGAALYFACRKIGSLALVRLRNRRLLLPLLFGMAVIVPPQLYVELVTGDGARFSYGEFYALYLDTGTEAYPEHQHGPLGLWTWNHLWFLAYLWLYTLLFVLVKPVLDRLATSLQTSPPGTLAVLAVPVVLLCIYRLALAEQYPPSNALVGDWYNHVRYISFLFGGYLLADCRPFWEMVRRYRWRLRAVAVIAYLVLLGIYHGWVVAALSGLGDPVTNLLVRLLASVNQWAWILALLGLAVHFLNRPGPVLRYMNEAILPWYLLHQTAIVLLAFSLSRYALPRGLEAIVLVIGTVAACALGYELVRRFRVGRLLFGLKQC
jgi:hypothetical protein